jgi:hypothetical protein
MAEQPYPLSWRDRLQAAFWIIVGVPLALLMLYLIVRSIDPPWSVSEAKGTILSWGDTRHLDLVLRYYKLQLLAKVDDGRTVGVSSERRTAPKVGERVIIQERIGLLGTRTFVELP